MPSGLQDKFYEYGIVGAIAFGLIIFCGFLLKTIWNMQKEYASKLLEVIKEQQASILLSKMSNEAVARTQDERNRVMQELGEAIASQASAFENQTSMTELHMRHLLEKISGLSTDNGVLRTVLSAVAESVRVITELNRRGGPL
jgi:hypothetical protein